MYYILENNIRVKKWMSGVACYSFEGTAKQFSLSPEEYYDFSIGFARS